MPNRDALALATRRYANAKAVTVALKGAILGLKARGELDGLTVHEFPTSVDGSVQGFDLAFTDRRIRMVVTGSTMQKGFVAIEVWRVPLVYGSELSSVTVLEVSKDGEIKLSAEDDSYWIESPGGAYDLVCHLVELINAPRSNT